MTLFQTAITIIGSVLASSGRRVAADNTHPNCVRSTAITPASISVSDAGLHVDYRQTSVAYCMRALPAATGDGERQKTADQKFFLSFGRWRQ